MTGNQQYALAIVFMFLGSGIFLLVSQVSSWGGAILICIALIATPIGFSEKYGQPKPSQKDRT